MAQKKKKKTNFLRDMLGLGAIAFLAASAEHAEEKVKDLEEERDELQARLDEFEEEDDDWHTVDET
jgi:hypothetical protein